ncbi:MAG: hypothetical protein PHP05_00270 [Sideroxydans sp.]|nr:hypothetical protein [Sideroxydans sp.]
MDTQVRITLHASRTYFILLSTLAFILILMLSTLPVADGWRWIGYLGVSASTALLFRRDVALLSKSSCISLAYGTERHISLILRDGQQLSGRVRADTLVLPWLILLNVATDGHVRRSLLLFPDGMTAEDHRHLRTLLRHSARL